MTEENFRDAVKMNINILLEQFASAAVSGRL